MNLSMSLKYPNHHNRSGKETLFIQMTWNGLIEMESSNFGALPYYRNKFAEKFGVGWDQEPELNICKIHSFRQGNRWRTGMKIHLIINNRTKDRFQFAPIVYVKSVQDVEMREITDEVEKLSINSIRVPRFGENGTSYRYFTMRVDGKFVLPIIAAQMAKNDGFENPADFFDWFKYPFDGQIVHWSEKKY